jgi:hypothetical protein
MRNAYRVVAGKPGGKGVLDILGVAGNIILKWNLRE